MLISHGQSQEMFMHLTNNTQLYSVRDHGGLGLSDHKKIIQKLASQYHPGALAVLVRCNQAQKCLQYDASNRLLQNSMEFST